MNITYRTNIGTFEEGVSDYFPASCVNIVINAIINDDKDYFEMDHFSEMTPLDKIIDFYLTYKNIAPIVFKTKPTYQQPS